MCSTFIIILLFAFLFVVEQDFSILWYFLSYIWLNVKLLQYSYNKNWPTLAFFLLFNWPLDLYWLFSEFYFIRYKIHFLPIILVSRYLSSALLQINIRFHHVLCISIRQSNDQVISKRFCPKTDFPSQIF